jgi:prepilin-type processing-associated H-X9-DG protein
VFEPGRNHSNRDQQAGAGFSQVDLLAVIVTLVLLVLLLTPALARTRVSDQSFQCRNNLRQLSTAWTMYADDYNGMMVPNWLVSPLAWINGNIGSVDELPGATNVNALKQGLLYSYKPSLGVYQCPTAFTAAPRAIAAKGVHIVRNYSLEGRMGGASAGDAARYGVGDTTWVLSSTYPQYKKMTEITRPAPAEAMTFLDESIETLDDGYFAVNYNDQKTAWQNSPTVRHGQAGVFAFADGHSEQWHWRALNVDQELDTPATGSRNTLVDLQRMQRAVLRNATLGM